MLVTIRSCFRLEKLFFGGKLDVSSVPKIPPKKSFQCENIIFLFLDFDFTFEIRPGCFISPY